MFFNAVMALQVAPMMCDDLSHDYDMSRANPYMAEGLGFGFTV